MYSNYKLALFWHYRYMYRIEYKMQYFTYSCHLYDNLTSTWWTIICIIKFTQCAINKNLYKHVSIKVFYFLSRVVKLGTNHLSFVLSELPQHLHKSSVHFQQSSKRDKGTFLQLSPCTYFASVWMNLWMFWGFIKNMIWQSHTTLSFLLNCLPYLFHFKIKWQTALIDMLIKVLSYIIGCFRYTSEVSRPTFTG